MRKKFRFQYVGYLAWRVNLFWKIAVKTLVVFPTSFVAHAKMLFGYNFIAHERHFGFKYHITLCAPKKLVWSLQFLQGHILVEII